MSRKSIYLSADAIVPYAYIQSDGGRGDSRRKKQYKDCVVRAIALAAGMDYDTTFDLCRKAGRKDNKGVRTSTVLRSLKRWLKAAMSLDVIRVKCRTMELTEFLEAFPDGTYLARTTRHAFCVMNGAIYDESPLQPTANVYEVWKLKPLHPEANFISRLNVNSLPIAVNIYNLTQYALLHPSTKEPGQFQVTYFDQYGLSGDTTYQTKEGAGAGLWRDGYRHLRHPSQMYGVLKEALEKQHDFELRCGIPARGLFIVGEQVTPLRAIISEAYL